MNLRIGVLALQGAFREHCLMLNRLGVEACEIRKPGELASVDALVIPGGESTTIGKLMMDFGLYELILERAQNGMPIFGTCAGLILLAREINSSQQPRLGLMDIQVERNAFGRQVDSFEVNLYIPAIGEEPFRAVFIRAPYITCVAPQVEVMAEYQGKIVMARQGNFLAAAFHPELTEDVRIHKYFLQMIGENNK